MAQPDPRVEEETATPIHGDPTWPDESERPNGSSDHGKGADKLGEGPEDDSGDKAGDPDEDTDSNGVSLTHVPIKRKGSRKR